MSAREPDFVEEQAQAHARLPVPLFDPLRHQQHSQSDEVTLKNPMRWIVLNDVFEAAPSAFFALVERWWYPLVASNNPEATRRFVRQQMMMGYPLFAARDPKDRELCWQINVRYHFTDYDWDDPRAVDLRCFEFDVLAFRGDLLSHDARVVMWLVHVGHLELIPLTAVTVRAKLVAYFDDPFVNYSFEWMAEQIFDTIPAQDIYVTPDDTTAPVAPPVKPRKDAPLEEWFDYYRACKAKGIRYSLKELASDTEYSYSYIRKKHTECYQKANSEQ